MSLTKTGTDHWARACLHPSSIQWRWRWRIDEARESVPCQAHLSGIERESVGFLLLSLLLLLFIYRLSSVCYLGSAQPRLVILIRSVGSSQTSACLFASDWSLRWLALLTSMACGTETQQNRRFFLIHNTHLHCERDATRRNARALPLSRLRAIHRVGREFILKCSPKLQCKKVELKWNQTELLWV